MIIAVDFDGTLVTDKWPQIGAPIQNNINQVKEWKRKGHRLILWTCRTGETLDQAVEYCRKELGLVFDAVNDNLPDMSERYGSNQRKVIADIYYDDKALNPKTNNSGSSYGNLCQRR